MGNRPRENFWKRRRDELSRIAGKRVSQFKIALLADCTPSYIGMLERGTIPALRQAPNLARAYRLPVEAVEAEIVKQTRAGATVQAAAK